MPDSTLPERNGLESLDADGSRQTHAALIAVNFSRYLFGGGR